MFRLVSTVKAPRIGTQNADQIKIADFNGDGRLDFVVTHIDLASLGDVPSQLQMFIGDGQGNFTDQSQGLFASAPWVNYVPRMIVDDFNGDGRPDIFGIDNGIDKMPFTGGQNKLFLSSAGQLVDATGNLPQAMLNNHGASAGDIDNDGDLDLLVNALMFDGNFLYLNNGLGVFSSANHLLPALTEPSPWGGDPLRQTHTASGLIDVNGDGWLDMILGTWDNPNSTDFTELYLNDGTGSFAASSAIILPSSGVPDESVLDFQEIDLNGDDMPDLAVSVTNGGDFQDFYKVSYTQLLVNLGHGVFRDETDARYPQNRAPGESTTWIKSVEVVDLNRDGYDDMVLDRSHEGPRVLFNDGQGRFTENLNGLSANLPPILPDQYNNLVAVGDVNNDAMPDLIVSKQIDGQMIYSTYLNQLSGPTGLGRIEGGFTNGSIYRFYNTETGTHFYSGSKQEVGSVLTTMPNFQFEGAAFSQLNPGAEGVDVLRFFNTETGVHFYTADVAEAEHIRASMPSFLFEGAAYQAHQEQVEGSMALYRFFNTQTGTHFYTANEVEMQNVRVELAGVMSYEGVAFYVGI